MNNEELQNKIVEKVQDKIAIFEFKKEDKKMKQSTKKLANIAATVVIAIGLSVGTVYAGTIIYEKIWKEPTKVSQEELDKEVEKIKEKPYLLFVSDLTENPEDWLNGLVRDFYSKNSVKIISRRFIKIIKR